MYTGPEEFWIGRMGLVIWGGGALARRPPIEKLEAAGAASVYRSADQSLDQSQRILRKAVYFVALL
jgi:hypothetical protein